MSFPMTNKLRVAFTSQLAIKVTLALKIPFHLYLFFYASSSKTVTSQGIHSVEDSLGLQWVDFG